MSEDDKGSMSAVKQQHKPSIPGQQQHCPAQAEAGVYLVEARFFLNVWASCSLVALPLWAASASLGAASSWQGLLF